MCPPSMTQRPMGALIPPPHLIEGGPLGAEGKGLLVVIDSDRTELLSVSDPSTPSRFGRAGDWTPPTSTLRGNRVMPPIDHRGTSANEICRVQPNDETVRGRSTRAR